MRHPTTAVLCALTAAMTLMVPAGPAKADGYLQCVPFARMLSGVQLFGDAWTWWNQAVAKYQTGGAPKAGAVLVFRQTGAMTRGHVAVVSQVLTDRVVQISHANWSRINGARGQIEKDVTVVDVSPAGDWSRVKVWNDPSKDLGVTVYPTYGFIYGDAKSQVLAKADAADAAPSTRQYARYVPSTKADAPAVQPAEAKAPGAMRLASLDVNDDRIGALLAATGR